MFNRPHHQRIAHVLSALDGSVLAQNACWFAGGTCIAVAKDLTKAIDKMQNRPGWLERCMQAMAIETPRAALWEKIRKLRRALPA